MAGEDCGVQTQRYWVQNPDTAQIVDPTPAAKINTIKSTTDKPEF